MELDESRPISRYRVDADVNWVGVGVTKGYVHVAEPLHTCGLDLLPVKLFVFTVKAYGHVKTVGEARSLGGLLVHRDLGKM